MTLAHLLKLRHEPEGICCLSFGSKQLSNLTVGTSGCVDSVVHMLVVVRPHCTLCIAVPTHAILEHAVRTQSMYGRL